MKKLVLAILMSLVAEVCLAQTPPNLENGWKPFGSYEGSHLDTVNVMNGNLMFHAPLIPGAPGRGALTFSYSLYGSSKDWQAVCGPLPGGAIGCKWQKGGTGVSIHITPSLSVHRTINKQYMSGQGTTTFAAYGYTVIDADGASHPVHGAAGTEDVYGEATQFDTADLSGYHLALSVPDGDYPNIRDQFTVTDRSGTVYQGSFGPTTGCGHPSLTGLSAPGNHPPLFDDTLAGDQYCSQVAFASLVTDSNGNQVSIRGPMNLNPTVDTLGRNPLFTGTSTTDYTGCASAHTITSATLYFYQDPNGVTRQIKLCNALIHLQTAFNQPNPYNTSITVQEASQDSFPVVSVVLADGSHWTFDYDSYGELSSVVLPTGGSISYAWTTVDFNACDPQNNTQRSRAVASRTLNDGQGRSSTWFYSWGAPSGGQQTNVVTDPLGNDTKHIFSEISSVALPAGLTPVCRFYETATVQYQGAQSANQPMQRSDTTYVATNAVLDNGGPGSTSAPGLTNVFATEVLTTLYTNRTATKVKKVHKDPDPGLGAGLPIFGNTVKELVYDWKDPNPNVPWVLLRETDTVYQWQKNSNYLTANMVDLPASTVVIDPVAANNTKSGCPINATGGTASCIAQSEYLYDEAAYFTSPSPLITTQHVAPPAAVRGNPTTVSHWLNASSLVSSHTNWYDTGEPYQKIDPLGHTTTLSYDSAYVGAYVTQTCSPTTNAGTVTHCVIAAYDFNTGVLTSFTDQNGQTSNYEYDRMFRITSAQAPVDAANGGLRATTSLSYSTTSLPWSVTRTRTITSALTDSATSMFDGLGRGNKGQHPMPGGTATVDTVYDPAGRVASVTNPYFNTSDATYGVTQNIYDALDRPLLVQKQDGSFATVTYQDNCTLAEDEAGKARRTCADALGRLYEVEEPGDSSAPAATDTSTVSTSATAIVSIGGSEQMVIIPAPPCPPRQICDQTPDTVYDSGTVSVTVSGHTTSAAYQQGDTASSVALHLANAINADGSAVVTASASGTQITLTAKTAGEAGDYTATYSTAWDTADFSAASFTGLVSNLRLLGGADLNQFAHTYLTLYFYDALGNLLCVEQHGNVAPGTSGATGCSAAPSNDAGSPWRVRRFTYDSLSRLLTAKNPESGLISYVYDNDGELLMKTSPAANHTDGTTQTISYCYDELHRVLAKGYSTSPNPPQQCLTAYPWLPNPAVIYTYDTGTNANGKLTHLVDQAGTADYFYDPLGRMTSETRVISGVSKSLSYGYNLDGSLKSLTYPSGATVTYTPDSAGRPLSAVDSGNGINYATGATYNAPGALTSLVNGNTGTFAGMTNTFTYNKRLQPVNMSAASPSQTVFSIGYDFHFGAGNNGNVYGITNYKDNGRNQSFTYDALNRLTSAQNAGTDCSVKVLHNQTEYWGNSYGYDAWGNLLQKTVTKCGAENLALTADAHNWVHATGLPDYQYDNAGNMTHDATANMDYAFDQENRITGAGGYTYTYDADGNRVKKSNGTGASAGTLYWYMAPGIVAESDQAGTLKSEYVFFAGERVARRDLVAPTGVFYYFSDHLKTASVVTDAAGVIKAESDYYPWGGELQFVANDSNHYKFTSKERDGESGLDYFGARYYSNGLGRFVSADWSPTPIPVPYANFGDPQSLNLHTFVRNIPTSQIDRDGHCPPCTTEDFTNGRIQIDIASGVAMDTGDPEGNIRAAQMAMSVASVVPVVNLMTMPLNAGLSLMTGHKGEAAATALSAIPGERIAASVWKLGNFARGVAIETALGKNLAAGFPVIDKFLNGTATSIKSIDLTAKTYQDTEKLAGTLDKYVDKVANFNGAQYGKDVVEGSKITTRELQVAIPKGSMSAAQQKVFDAAAARAAQLKNPVKLSVTQVQ